jgi:hypothetical protein
MEKTMDALLNRLLAYFVLAIGLIAGSADAGAFTLQLTPANGQVGGPAGGVVGWGYSITNDSSSYLVPTAVNADLFSYGSPLVLFDFPAIAPHSSWASDFVANTSGLFQLTWDQDAPVGFANTGQFSLAADFYDNDPLAGGQYVGSAGEAVAGYSAVVAVPEPCTGLLLGGGLLAMTKLRRRRT